MSSLKHKLARLELQGGAERAAHGESAARGSRIAELRAQLERIGSKLGSEPRPARPTARVLRDEVLHARGAARLSQELDPRWLGDELGAPTLGARLPGELCEGTLGPLRRLVTAYAADHRHGVTPVGSALLASAADVALLALDPALAGVDLARALYIDTETTGLAGGAGTLPFLIGMAWFEGESLRVEQLLLERPGLEAPLLARLSERLAEASVVVSFNGKSFDWPLLRTRFILQRLPAPPLPAHLDLLHCARRVYKRRLGSVRLVHLEEQLLGFARVGDIPGEAIPQTYLGFLRGWVDGAALMPIVEHNRNDLVALAALLGELARRFRGEQPLQDARDQLGFAGVAARAAAHERALGFAQAAAEADLRGELAPQAHYLAGELQLRRGDVSAAERAFQLAIEAACGAPSAAARAHLALSKLYEHRLKRLVDALEHARCAAPHEGEPAAARRIARLTRKCRGAGLITLSEG